MDDTMKQQPFWNSLEQIVANLKNRKLADVFRFISFERGETYGPHRHLRIEINYVKRGFCMLHLDKESVTFREGEMMIISSDVNHAFEAGTDGCTLIQLEFLPDILSNFDLDSISRRVSDAPHVALFSEENKLIKIVNNVRMMRAVQRIVNELNEKKHYYTYLVVMYYAELLILIYRYLDENYVPIGGNENLRKAISIIRMNFYKELTISGISEEVGVSERQLRNLFTRYLNLSPLDYLNQIRINKAIDLLRNTEFSIKEICYQCGFRSPQYFSRIFKQMTGISPHEISK